ncbi:MAG: hypothetical protein P0119_19410 [Nitrospira sp.]|nr:hypothetical protein [Nitrospira sp.]
MTQIEINTVTMAVGIVTAMFAIVQYGLTKRSEFRKRFWEEQLEIYRRTCVAASSIATASVITAVEKERQTFWRLYWGELSILESKAVKTAMEAFGDQLRVVEAEHTSPKSLEQFSYRLARECRASLGKTWDPVGIDDLS